MIIINKFILRPLKAIFGRFLALFLSGPAVRWPSLIKFYVSRRETAFFWSAGHALKIALILGVFGFAAPILNPYFVCSLLLSAIHSERLENSGLNLQLLNLWSSQSWRSKAAARALIYRPNYSNNSAPAGPIRSGSNGLFSRGIFGFFCLMGLLGPSIFILYLPG